MSLKKIAEMVGVSPSTVSRVLNNTSYNCASEELKAKIWAAAKEIQYTPNSAAKNLKLGIKTEQKIYELIIILGRSSSLEADPFFKELFRSIEEYVFQYGGIIKKILKVEDFKEHNYDLKLECDGIVILGRCPHKLLTYLTAHHKNIVGVGRNPTSFDIDEVICDGKSAAMLAVEHFIRLGYKKIAYIGDCSYETRYVGYTETLLKYNIPFDFSYIKQTDQTEKSGFQAMNELLNDLQPMAVLCANDITAIGAIKACNACKKKTPMPSIIGIDNIEACQTINPTLSTVNIPKAEMGKFAVQILFDRIKHQHFEHVRIELPCRLIERESCRSQI